MLLWPGYPARQARRLSGAAPLCVCVQLSSDVSLSWSAGISHHFFLSWSCLYSLYKPDRMCVRVFALYFSSVCIPSISPRVLRVRLLRDKKSVRNGEMPADDAEQNIIGGSVSAERLTRGTATVVKLRWSRLLETGDPQDFIIPRAKAVKVIFAMNPRAAAGYHGNAFRSFGTIDFTSGVVSVVRVDGCRVCVCSLYAYLMCGV